MRKVLYATLSLALTVGMVWVFLVAPLILSGLVVAAVAMLVLLPDLLGTSSADTRRSPRR